VPLWRLRSIRRRMYRLRPGAPGASGSRVWANATVAQIKSAAAAMKANAENMCGLRDRTISFIDAEQRTTTELYGGG